MPMRIVTKISKFDLWKFFIGRLPRDWVPYCIALAVTIFVACDFFNEIGFPATTKDLVLAITITLIIGGFISLFFIFIHVSSRVSKSAILGGALGDHIYIMSEAGIEEVTEASRVTSKWEGIRDIQLSRSFVLFDISRYDFHLIPRRSFASEEDMVVFSAKANEYWKSKRASMPK